MDKWTSTRSNERLTRSWADVCIANASLCTSIAMSTGSSSQGRRSSYMPVSSMRPPVPSERYRASSLVVPSQNSSLLHPLSGSRREFSLESGYLSHDCGEGSSSTPNSPKKFTLNQTKYRKSGLSQSTSVEDEVISPTASRITLTLTTATSTQSAREKRQMFHK